VAKSSGRRIGEVVSSRCKGYEVGDVITTLTGFQEYVIVRDDVFSTPIPGESDQLAIMSVYGPTGATAYSRMTDVGRPQAGDTVVSRPQRAPPDRWPARSQDRRRPGGRHRGWPGESAVVEDFGFDACIDYKNDNLEAASKSTAPSGSTSTSTRRGPISRGAGRLATNHGGALLRHLQLPDRRTTPDGQLREPAVEDRDHAGFNALDQWGTFDEAFASLRQWEHEAGSRPARPSLKHTTRASDALNGLFTGANIGKMLVKASEPTTV